VNHALVERSGVIPLRVPNPNSTLVLTLGIHWDLVETAATLKTWGKYMAANRFDEFQAKNEKARMTNWTNAREAQNTHVHGVQMAVLIDIMALTLTVFGGGRRAERRQGTCKEIISLV